MKTAAHVFKTFPEFSELTLLDREKYESLIADYPPISDISFATLMTWWSALNSCKISQIDGNLVIAYWMPGDEEASGFSLIGTHNVDDSICTILDYLHEQNKPARLVHVPEFVVNSMRYPELYSFSPERKNDECVISVAKLSSVSNMAQQKRWKVRRFLAEVEEKRVNFESLDLTQYENQQLLLDLHEEWEHRGPMNNIGIAEKEYMKQAIKHADPLGHENLCLYIDGKIHSFILYQLPYMPKYAIINLARFSYGRPFLFEFCAYEYAKWFASQGIKYVNIDSDQDHKALRVIKLGLGPINFFRKYTVEPST